MAHAASKGRAQHAKRCLGNSDEGNVSWGAYTGIDADAAFKAMRQEKLTIEI